MQLFHFSLKRIPKLKGQFSPAACSWMHVETTETEVLETIYLGIYMCESLQLQSLFLHLIYIIFRLYPSLSVERLPTVLPCWWIMKELFLWNWAQGGLPSFPGQKRVGRPWVATTVTTTGVTVTQNNYLSGVPQTLFGGHSCPAGSSQPCRDFLLMLFQGLWHPGGNMCTWAFWDVRSQGLRKTKWKKEGIICRKGGISVFPCRKLIFPNWFWQATFVFWVTFCAA